MVNKNKKIIFFSLIFLFLAFQFSCAFAQSDPFKYTPLEKLPVAENKATPTDFYTYVETLYGFLVSAAGICALIMIIIGGFMYSTSAGNNASMEKAKSVIADAIIGLLLVMTAYLILYIINPDLTIIKKINRPPSVVPLKNDAVFYGRGSKPCGNPVTLGLCAANNPQFSCFNTTDIATLNKASFICQAESGGNETIMNTSVVCMDGNPVVGGLFQINMTANPVYEGTTKLDCPSAFEGGMLSGEYGSGRVQTCKVKDQALYDRCKAAVTNASNNITTACAVYNGQGRSSFAPWSTNCTQ